jgi:hypothetical protein
MTVGHIRATRRASFGCIVCQSHPSLSVRVLVLVPLLAYRTKGLSIAE